MDFFSKANELEVWIKIVDYNRLDCIIIDYVLFQKETF